jgi:hypothetical protein
VWGSRVPPTSAARRPSAWTVRSGNRGQWSSSRRCAGSSPQILCVAAKPCSCR